MPEEEWATACGRCAASEPTDGCAGWTGTSELGCWLMDPLFRVGAPVGASEPGKIAEGPGNPGSRPGDAAEALPRALPLRRGLAELAASREGRKGV
ncbi:hypothetical protein Smic_42710 [Streptomyces microflavus]|uniref:Uncharacterized protein n=1 Tax=Streptomyces microflavus TaxID=1919 RepID=A0A7J0CVF4_STRMI|nr:hypothetical protein Smic_42710 [Streptomyces microflavus]